uniref:Ig-like domain-containing protein n=1 Tax=Esox lucius TaxID=8010 RepID=A0A3P8Y6E9_ESOLU
MHSILKTDTKFGNNRTNGCCETPTLPVKFSDTGTLPVTYVDIHGTSFQPRIPILPKATLLVKPNPVYPVETVTLTCSVGSYSDWRYKWYKDRNDNVVSQSGSNNPGPSYTISITSVSDQGQYWCEGHRVSRPTSSQPSTDITLTVLGQFFYVFLYITGLYSGETVTLQCDISDYTDWTYWWYRNKQLLSPGSPSKTITTLSDQVSQYQCQGRRTDRPQSSQLSVSLNISNKPKATLSLDKKDILIGSSVTLTCTVESSGWMFYWYRHRQDSEPVATTSGSSYTLSQVSVSDGGQYRCRAGRGDPWRLSEDVTVTSRRPAAVLTFQPNWPQIFMGESVTMICNIQEGDVTDWTYAWHKNYDDGSNTDFMNTVKHQINATDLSVSGVYRCLGRNRHNQHYSMWSNRVRLTSSVSVRISPNRTQHFTSKSLSLICDLKGNSPGWRLMRYTETGVESGCSPNWGSITGSTCTITSTDTGDSGVYWCESGSGQYSNAVNITVSDGDVILESPAHIVNEGDSLTLRCKCRNQRCTNSKVDFYRDGVLIRNETTGEMTISAVMKSDEGFYKCKSDEIESPESWVTVRGDNIIMITVSLHQW